MGRNQTLLVLNMTDKRQTAEKLLKKAYDVYIDLMLSDLPIDRIGEVAVEDVSGFGTTVDEKVLEIKRLKIK